MVACLPNEIKTRLKVHRSLPVDHFSASKALCEHRKWPFLRPKMTRKQTRYHGNETAAPRKLRFITVISTKGAEIQEPREVKSNKQKLAQFFTVLYPGFYNK